MEALQALQSVDGSWADAQKLLSLCGAAVASAGADSYAAVSATVIAFAILRNRLADQMAKWAMIQRKPLRWLFTRPPAPERLIAGLIARL
jgi:hypothetical protein